MCKLFVYHTGIGPFFIALSNGRYRAIFEDEPLGNFGTVEQAVEHLASEQGLIVPGDSILRAWVFQRT